MERTFVYEKVLETSISHKGMKDKKIPENDENVLHKGDERQNSQENRASVLQRNLG